MEKEKVLALIKKAENLIPLKMEKDLKPLNGIPNIPDWHNYETNIWRIGEEIRQIIAANKVLRKDAEINNLILNICLNKNSKRGRQSFILLLGYKHLSEHSRELIKMINDNSVDGHIIDTIYKMQSAEFVKEIRPFKTNQQAWIRKIASKYLEKYAT
tara:strand:+ start:122 stop:592 length:471 start_codon:yes stop_codon:yes gene_type:complete